MSEFKYLPEKNWEVQAFTSEQNAEFFANELRDAMKLLNHKGWTVEVYKQKTSTNK